MEALFPSFLLVLFAEIGDKTQLLSILLAARFRTFWPIAAGVLAATLFNHAVSAYAGAALAERLDGMWVQGLASLLFIGVGAWTLVPDTAPQARHEPGRSVFVYAATMFFLAEIGDKTQLATVALAAEYRDIALVTLGTTLGMIAANIPAILLGERILRLVPLRHVRYAASVLFIGFGAYGLYTLC